MSELVWGIKNGDLEIVKDIVESKDIDTVIQQSQNASKHQDERTFFFKKNIDLNKEIDGRPPLHYAADYGQEHVIQYLIKKGADVNVKDKHGISALLAAIWEGHTRCVKTLLDEGASKDGTAPDGTTYFDSADKDDIKALLKK